MDQQTTQEVPQRVTGTLMLFSCLWSVGPLFRGDELPYHLPRDRRMLPE